MKQYLPYSLLFVLLAGLSSCSSERFAQQDSLHELMVETHPAPEMVVAPPELSTKEVVAIPVEEMAAPRLVAELSRVSTHKIAQEEVKVPRVKTVREPQVLTSFQKVLKPQVQHSTIASTQERPLAIKLIIVGLAILVGAIVLEILGIGAAAGLVWSIGGLILVIGLVLLIIAALE